MGLPWSFHAASDGAVMEFLCGLYGPLVWVVWECRYVSCILGAVPLWSVCLCVLRDGHGGHRTLARHELGPLQVKEPAARECRGLGYDSGSAGRFFVSWPLPAFALLCR